MWILLLLRPFLKYIILGVTVISLALGAYFYVKNKGYQEAFKKVEKQTEVIVKKREKTDEKVSRSDDASVRNQLREWVCEHPCDTN